MFGFVFQKIWSKKWMVLSLLLGNLLMVAIAAAGPMYSEAALQRTLTRELSDYYVENSKHPGTILLWSFSDSKKAQYERWEQSEELFDQMLEELDVPAIYRVDQYYKEGVRAVSDIEIKGKQESADYKLTSYTDVEDHITIMQGEMCSGEVEDNVIEVIVSEKTYITHRLMLGQELELSKEKDASGNPYKIRITGVFENSQQQDVYWLSSPADWDSVLLMDAELFRKLFVRPDTPIRNVRSEWFAVTDYTRMQGGQVSYYMDVFAKYQEQFEELGTQNLSVYAQKVFENFVVSEQKANITIVVLLVPIFVLLAAFIFMVSGQMLTMEQNEIAVYKSRGANKGQIILVYLLQSACIAVLSLAGGIPLGVFTCKMLGASNSFLEFVNRAALPVEVGLNVLLVAVAAAVFSVCTMVLPVFKYADVNIVAHKRGKNHRQKSPLWQRLFLDVLLLGFSGYGLYQYNSQREYLAQKVLDGAALDPILYICSSLFMIGAGLLVLRIFPWVVRLIFRIGQKWWSPALYTSFLRIIRTRSNQGFLMIFLILTVAMGVYNAQVARTINANEEDKIRYLNGADIVLQEITQSEDQVANETGTYEAQDFGKYSNVDGIDSVTQVVVDKNVTASVAGGELKNVMLMGIHTKEFGETVWFKESLLPLHYHEYLNAIAQNSQAILVSSNFRELYGYKLGDVLSYTTGKGTYMMGVICGFVDYWPSYAPVTVRKGKDGLYSETENFLIVAHRSQIEATGEVMRYQVWIKTKGSSGFIYDFAEENDVQYSVFEDAAAQLIQMKNDPIFQGTNGILTIGFICILLLCTIGFLIYWILSIQSRTLQFGIFRAMGMSMREVFTMLINEQIFITGVSIGAGVLVGALTSKLFVPLIQIAYSSADQVLPLEIVSLNSDYVRLFAVIGAVIVICMIILGVLISKIKIAQALKLGED